MGDVGVGVFHIVLIIEHFCSPIRLDEEVAGRKEPGKGEKVGGECGGENVQSNRRAPRRVELVGWVVLTVVIDKAAPLVPTQNLRRTELEEEGG